MIFPITLKTASWLQVRNAEPYREFQSSEDNDRYYGMNEVGTFV